MPVVEPGSAVVWRASSVQRPAILAGVVLAAAGLAAGGCSPGTKPQLPYAERIAAQRAALAEAEAALRAIEAALDNMVLRSPFAGIVTVRHREPGEIVAAGAPVLAVLNRDDRWIRIYIPETRIGAVRPGQRATISTDTYRDREYAGEVIFIASEAEFTPKNVQTSEERVKLVYAVKVRVTGDPAYDLKPGMPADVRIELAR